MIISPFANAVKFPYPAEWTVCEVGESFAVDLGETITIFLQSGLYVADFSIYIKNQACEYYNTGILYCAGFKLKEKACPNACHYKHCISIKPVEGGVIKPDPTSESGTAGNTGE